MNSVHMHEYLNTGIKEEGLQGLGILGDACLN